MKGTALTRFTLWLTVLCFLTFGGIESAHHDFDRQLIGMLLIRIVSYNLCFLMLGVSMYVQHEPGRIFRIMRLITLLFLIVLSSICHYFLITNGGQGVGILFLMFVFVSVLTVLSLELVAWRTTRKRIPAPD